MVHRKAPQRRCHRRADPRRLSRGAFLTSQPGASEAAFSSSPPAVSALGTSSSWLDDRPAASWPFTDERLGGFIHNRQPGSRSSSTFSIWRRIRALRRYIRRRRRRRTWGSWIQLQIRNRADALTREVRLLSGCHRSAAHPAAHEQSKDRRSVDGADAGERIAGAVTVDNPVLRTIDDAT